MYEINDLNQLQLVNGGIDFEQAAIDLNCYIDIGAIYFLGTFLPGFIGFVRLGSPQIGILAATAGFLGSAYVTNTYSDRISGFCGRKPFYDKN